MVLTRDAIESALVSFDDEEDWVERRRQSLGGSDLACILGYDSYVSEWTLWKHKTSAEPLPEGEDREWLDYGNDVEPGIVAFYRRKLQRLDPTLEVIGYRHALFPDPQGAPLHFTPDALVYRAPRWELVAGIDAKRVNVFANRHAKPGDKWGDVDTSTMPKRCKVQGIAGCGLFGVREWTFVADRGTVPESFPLIPEDGAAEGLREIALDWWDTHVVGGVEPEIDGSASTSDTLKALLGQGGDEPGEVLPPTDDDFDLAEQYRSAKLASKEAAERLGAIKNTLIRRIGMAHGIKGIAAYPRVRGRRSLDVDGLCRDLAAQVAERWVATEIAKAKGCSLDDAMAEALAEVAALVHSSRAEHTTRGAGHRRFDFKLPG